MATLDDILEGKDEPVAEKGKEASEPEPKPQEAEPEKPDGDEPGKAAEAEPKGEEKGASPASEEKKSVEDLVRESEGRMAAVQAERERRQEAERVAREATEQLGVMQAQIARLQSAQAQKDQPQRPDPFEDPEGARRYDEQMLDQREINLKVNLSAEMARQAYPDFDEVMKDWQRIEATDPMTFRHLFLQAIQQPSPAGWAYQQMKNRRLLSEIGNPEEYRTKLETEIREKLEAEMKAKAEESAKQQAAEAIPQSLASERSQGSPRGSAFSGPTPLTEIIGE